MAEFSPEYSWDHVHLRSPDVAATAAWFQDKFSAGLFEGTKVTAERADVVLGGVRMVITNADGTNPPPVTPYQGLDHFGLAVRDLDKVAAGLKAKGVEFTREPVTPRPGIRICFIRGPQGMSIELLERDAKYI